MTLLVRSGTLEASGFRGLVSNLDKCSRGDGTRRGYTMQLPTVFRSSTHPLPPMYAWPRSVKRALLALSVLAVLAAYLLLAGGVIAVLAVLAERVSH